MAIVITPLAPTFDDVAMTYTIPAMDGVTYQLANYGTRAAGTYAATDMSYTVYAIIGSGYEAASGATTMWEHRYPTPVTPAEVVWDHFGHSYRIDSTYGVDYYANGVLAQQGTYNDAAGVVEVEAVPKEYFKIADGAVSYWAHDFDSETGNVAVTPYPPIFDDVQNTYMIPLMRGVSYRLAGSSEPLAADLYNGFGDITIEAHFGVGYELAAGETGVWSHSFPPAPVLVSAAAPIVDDKPGTFNDRFTIPESEGVQYRVNGTVYPAGLYAGQSSVVVQAEALAGYAIDQNTQYEWEFSFGRESVKSAPITYSFYAFETKSGNVKGRLPLTIEGDMTLLMQDFGAASFSINDANRPWNWKELIKQHEMSIAVQDDSTGKIIWAGFINGFNNGASSGTSFSCLTFESYLSQRYVGDIDFGTRDQAAWVSLLVAAFEAGGVGFGLVADAKNTGVPRSIGYKMYENKSFFAAINELSAMEDGFEWTIDCEWADANKNKVKKTLRTGFPTIGNVTPNPNLAFNFPGNVMDYDYSEPMSQDNFATHVVVLGEGSGIKQVRSEPQTDTAKETKIPRIEVLKNVSGIAYTSDATTLAKGYAAGLSNPLFAIKLTLSGEENESLRNMQKGDSARLAMVLSDRPPINEVWRVVAVSRSADGTPSPTLARMADGSKKFPRIPGDTTNLSRDLRDTKTDANTYSDPLSQGFPLRGSDGSGLEFGPDGSITAFDSFGNETPFFDPSTGSIGSGVLGDGIPQGYFYEGVIANPPASEYAPLDVYLDGAPDITSCTNWAENKDGTGPRLLSRGDTVSVSRRASDGSYVVTGVIRAKDNVYARNYRLVIDRDNIAGFGVNSYLHEKPEGGFRVYQPNKEVIEVPAPSIGDYHHWQFYQNNIYAWMHYGGSGDDQESIRLFRYLKSSLFWEEVPLLPAVSANRYRQHVVNELFSRPTMATVNRASVTKASTGESPIQFMLQIDRLTTPGQAFDSSTYQLESRPTSADAYVPSVSVVVNGKHAFVQVDTGLTKVYYIDLDTHTISEVVQDGSFFTYIGEVSNGNWGVTIGVLNTLRVADNGDMYRAHGVSDQRPSPGICERKLGSSSPVLHQLVTAEEKIVGPIYCQRDRNSSTFYASGRVELQQGSASPWNLEAMWKVVGGTSTVVLKPGPGPAAATYGPLDSTSAVPTQLPDGTITAVVDLSVGTGQQWGLKLRTFQSEFG